jgi:hypothetical protein
VKHPQSAKRVGQIVVEERRRFTERKSKQAKKMG